MSDKSNVWGSREGVAGYGLELLLSQFFLIVSRATEKRQGRVAKYANLAAEDLVIEFTQIGSDFCLEISTRHAATVELPTTILIDGGIGIVDRVNEATQANEVNIIVASVVR